jgi:hypothetical protein
MKQRAQGLHLEDPPSRESLTRTLAFRYPAKRVLTGANAPGERMRLMRLAPRKL